MGEYSSARQLPVREVLLVPDTRACAQCGTIFAPRREHARFCSPRCRVAWNQQAGGQAGNSILDWAVIAMRDALGRIPSVRIRDPAGVLAVISEAVWRITIVDATLVRYHPQAYDLALDRSAPLPRLAIEDTFAGLRFVRNQMDRYPRPADFVQPHAGPDNHGITWWQWRRMPQPAVAALPPRAQDWEMTRYRAYQARLADRRIGETFDEAADFVELVLRCAAGEAAAHGPALTGTQRGQASAGPAQAPETAGTYA